MLIAFVGAHGTGKTTTCKALHKQLGKQQWDVFEDSYRLLCRQLGYSNPREPILQEQHKEITVTAMLAACLGSLLEWSQVKDRNGLIDLGPASMLAYHRYWMKICDKPVSPFLLSLYQHVAAKIDYYIYLPTGVFPIQADSMRSPDPIFQKDIDQWVLVNLEEMNVPESGIIRLDNTDVDGRVQEILAALNSQA